MDQPGLSHLHKPVLGQTLTLLVDVGTIHDLFHLLALQFLPLLLQILMVLLLILQQPSLRSGFAFRVLPSYESLQLLFLELEFGVSLLP